jgi:two-component system CheB/CheR fusion protein
MEYDLISAKERIEESENHLRNILELSNLSMAIIAFDGTIEFINQQAIKTFGYLHEDIPNMDCWWNLAYPDESYRKQTIEQFTSAVNKAIVEKSEIERREYCPTCKDGTVKTIIIFGVIVNGKIFVMFEDISERKNAELELIKSKDKIEESEEKFRSAFQYAAYGIVLVDIDGRFIRVNDSMCKMLGYNEQEFLEKTFSEITYSDDINIGLNYTKELIQGKRKYFWLEKRYLHKNGNIIWGLVSASAIFVKDKGVSYLVVQIQDITEQKRINDALITSESRLQFISRLTSDYIFELDVDESGKTEMTFVSENFNKITGGTINDIKTPERLFKILHPDDANELSRLVKIIISTGSAEELECRSFIKGNEMRWVSISAKAKIDEKTKKVIAVVGTVKDITERKMAEEQIMNALKKAEESDKLKSAFLANMSHELRTPINGIIGFSNLLLKPDNTLEKKEKYVSQINASTSMLLRLIEDIIDIAKIESGSLTIEKSPCKVSDILNELYVHYQLELKARSKEHIQLVYTPFKDLSLTVVTDPFRLRQVLLNLLSNAVKFTSQGKIEYGFTLENNEIIFYVKDTGIGIKQEYLKQIFERFAQLELSLSRKFGGTGLGLTISKNIIELLGGKIWVESEWERGSSFYFKIPADIIPATNEIVENLIFNPFEYQWGKFTILVAEDDDLNYMFIEEMLVDTKIKLVRAKNGLEAIDIIKSNPEIVLVLMDIQMPFMDGYQSTKMILSIKPHLPIIAQTAFALASEKEMSFKAGCIDYISKPIDLEELLLKIKKYLPVKF